MCGIFGVVKTQEWGIGMRERDIFTQMLAVGMLRGQDGTGIFIVDSNRVTRTLKCGGPPRNLVHDKMFDPFFNKYSKNYSAKETQDRILVGHHRSATVGEATTANAHPHVFGHISLVHNGTLRAYSELPNLKDFAVDSMALASAINSLGIDEAIKMTHGAYAIVYFDEMQKTLNFLRNDERPLTMAVDAAMNRIYFASERKMLEWILDRNHIDVVKDVEIADLPIDTLVSFELDNIKPHMRTVKGPKVTSYFRGYGYFEEAESAFVDVSPKTYPVIPGVAYLEDKREKKKVQSVVKKMKKLGIEVKPIKELKGLTRGAQIVFDVRDYVDEDQAAEKFIIMGNSRTLDDTTIKMRFSGLKQVDQLFEHGQVIAIVKSIIEYPAALEGEEKYCIWVGEPQIYFPNNTYPKLTYDAKGNPAH